MVSECVWTQLKLAYYCVRLTLKALYRRRGHALGTTVKSEMRTLSLQTSISRGWCYRFGVRRLRVREMASFHASAQLVAVASSACTCTKFGRYVVWLTDILLTLLSIDCICILKHFGSFVNIKTKVFYFYCLWQVNERTFLYRTIFLIGYIVIYDRWTGTVFCGIIEVTWDFMQESSFKWPFH